MTIRQVICHRAVLAFAGGIALTVIAAACSSSSGAGEGPTSAANTGGSSPTQLRFNSDGTPNLSGVTLQLGNSAGSAVASDTVTWLVPQILKRWGADTSYTLGQFNTNDIAALAGRLTSNAGEMFGELDAGLTVFGPNQAHVDYVLVAAAPISSVKQLQGQPFAATSRTGPDYGLLEDLLQNQHWGSNSVHIIFTNNAGANVSELIQGAVKASWVHSSDLLTLKASGHKFNVLSLAAVQAPYLADSYMAAAPPWLKANPAYAEAADLAWIEAANTFNNHSSAWEADAQDYTHAAESASSITAAYQALKTADPYSLANQAEFTPKVVAQNYAIDKAAGNIKAAGVRSESQYAAFGPWSKAWAYYQAHQSLFSGQ
ncbi:MAG: ABC transporter substrate-binding protein [Streptosporangiaceae bacterium]